MPDVRSAMVPICGRQFPLVFDKNGVEHVKLRDLCAPFGLDAPSQISRLKEHAWARVGMIPSRRSDGKLARFQCLPLRRVPMFFATLDAGRVNEGFRPLLIRMQDESADAIADYFQHGGAIRREALPEQLVRLQQLIEEMLRPTPATDFIWPPGFVKRYEAWNGRAWREGDPQPFSMKSTNAFFYEMIFPPEVVDVLRKRGLEEACRLHQLLTDEPRGYVRRCLDQAAKLAEECASEREWRARMRRWYGKTKALLRGQSELSL